MKMSTPFSPVLKYFIVGCLNTFIGLVAIYSFQIFFDFSPYQSNLCGYLICHALSFVAQGSFSFNSRLTFYSFLRYSFIVSFLWLFNVSVLHLLLEFGVNSYVSQFISVAAYAVLGFFLHKHFTFSSRRS